jgi:hypothetical protein
MPKDQCLDVSSPEERLVESLKQFKGVSPIVLNCGEVEHSALEGDLGKYTQPLFAKQGDESRDPLRVFLKRAAARRHWAAHLNYGLCIVSVTPNYPHGDIQELCE